MCVCARGVEREWGGCCATAVDQPRWGGGRGGPPERGWQGRGRAGRSAAHEWKRADTINAALQAIYWQKVPLPATITKDTAGRWPLRPPLPRGDSLACHGVYSPSMSGEVVLRPLLELVQLWYGCGAFGGVWEIGWFGLLGGRFLG